LCTRERDKVSKCLNNSGGHRVADKDVSDVPVPIKSFIRTTLITIFTYTTDQP